MTILLVKSPPCGFVGNGRKVLVVGKEKHKHTFESPVPNEKKKKLNGIFSELRVGLAKEGCDFFLDGSLPNGCTIYRDAEKKQWLENTEDKRVPETEINCWGCVEHKEWAKEYVFNGDGTVSPKPNPKNVCLGLNKKNDGRVVFVPRNDKTRRLVIGGGDELAGYFEELRVEAAKAEAAREAARHAALSRLTPAFCTAFRDQGYCKLESLVPKELVLSARGEINRQLGEGNKTSDAFKAKTFASHPAILSLVRDSAVPAVLSELLGGDEEWYRARLGTGQLALRFPGDMCPAGTKCGPEGAISKAHFDGIRKGWHIDGCPNQFIPGVTDHFGKIHNFDMLIGVLLSDTVDKKMAGELVVYPGSHHALASYFKSNRDVLNKLRDKGMEHLPTAQTDALFKQPVHCTGKAGDVFMANYMTAHLIAPNVSADIRYAVYFRVSGPAFEKTMAQGGGNVSAMLDPWSTWKGLHKKCGGGAAAAADASGAQPPPLQRRPSTLAEEARERDVQRHLASADYEYLQRHHSRQILQDAGAGGAQAEALEALKLMFPHVDPAAMLDVLTQCRGNADKAAEHLLQLFPPPKKSKGFFGNLFGGAAKVAQS